MTDKAPYSSKEVDKLLSKRDISKDWRNLQAGGNSTNSTVVNNSTIAGNGTLPANNTVNDTTVAPTIAPTMEPEFASTIAPTYASTMAPTPSPTPKPTTFVDKVQNRTGSLRGSSEALEGALSFFQNCEDVNVTQPSGNITTNEECDLNVARTAGVAAGVVGFFACAVVAGCASARCGRGR